MAKKLSDLKKPFEYFNLEMEQITDLKEIIGRFPTAVYHKKYDSTAIIVFDGGKSYVAISASVDWEDLELDLTARPRLYELSQLGLITEEQREEYIKYEQKFRDTLEKQRRRKEYNKLKKEFEK